jgi:SAM-dependent methyltransferase
LISGHRSKTMPMNPETLVRPDVAIMQMEQQLEQVRQAYDLTVDQYRSGTDWLAQVPEAFKNSPEFQALMQEPCNSSAPENRQYLDPQPGMRFLDVGCCANLANHRLDQWPSTYYGVDISPALIEAMQGFVANHQISIGGLHVAEVADLPFETDFFDIADVIGVLEYCTLDHTERALAELNRVLKPGAKMVVDIPNLAHPLVETMFQLEDYLGRPNVPKPQAAFERLLTPLFAIDRVDDSHVMLKYFVRAIKGKN